jgi:hypothetical protein
MDFSAEQLLVIARDYWPSDMESYLRPEASPAFARLNELWRRELTRMDRWSALLGELRADLPEFIIGNATAPGDASFRCVAYPKEEDRQPTRCEWVVVGCLSVLVPVYTVYGVQYTYTDKKRSHQVFFDPLPREMRAPADIIARRIEARFEASALPRGIAETPIPLFVDPREPPNTTLFHALFISQPERVP